MKIDPRRTAVRRTGRALAALVLLAMAGPSAAHQSAPLEGRLELTPPGELRLELVLDLDSLATGRALGHGGEAARREVAALDPEQRQVSERRLRETLRRRLRFRIDGQRTGVEIELPKATAEAGTFGDRAVFHGQGPANSTSLVLEVSRSFPALQIEVVRGPKTERLAIPKGEASPPLPWPTPPP
ncbi:MAG: hypothetical protein AAF604_23210 [Acidobacteriota bacterium]